jgi:hypothetical protein
MSDLAAEKPTESPLGKEKNKPMNTKKIIIATVITAALIGLIAWYLSASKVQDNRLIFFYRTDCPHCKNVEDYVAANNIEQKITFEKLEVGANQGNANVLFSKLGICGVDTSAGAPVPVLWDGKDPNLANNQRCTVGDVDIIKYFSDKIK